LESVELNAATIFYMNIQLCKMTMFKNVPKCKRRGSLPHLIEYAIGSIQSTPNIAIRLFLVDKAALVHNPPKRRQPTTAASSTTSLLFVRSFAFLYPDLSGG
jgi:hypothetical protein